MLGFVAPISSIAKEDRDVAFGGCEFGLGVFAPCSLTDLVVVTCAEPRVRACGSYRALSGRASDF